MARYTQAVRRIVLARDRGCIAGPLGFPHVCPRNALGQIHPRDDFRPGVLTLDHVRDEPMAGKTACSDPGHLVALCVWAHQTSGWATANRPVLRLWLTGRYRPRELRDLLRAGAV